MARAPPIIASNPPSAVIMPMSDSTPKTSITIPHVLVELGALYIDIAPIIMRIPNMRNTYRRNPRPVKNASNVPSAAHRSPPKSTNIPPIKDRIKGVVGFSTKVFTDDAIVST